MQAKDIMTTNPACCTPTSTIRDAARMMVEYDCGEIPVLDTAGMPVGVITDRDIVCRVVASGIDTNSRVMDYMTTPVVTGFVDDSVERCCHVMREHMIRRLPIVDHSGYCVGIVSQADFAQKTNGYTVETLVKQVSIPTPHASM